MSLLYRYQTMGKVNVLKANKKELCASLKIREPKAEKIMKDRQRGFINDIRDIKCLFSTEKYENHVKKNAFAGKAKPYKPAKKSE